MFQKLLLNWDRHPDFPDAKGPSRAHPTDAGMDIFAAEDVTINPGEVVRVRTGICIAPSWVDSGLNPEPSYRYNEAGGWTLAVLAWDKSGIGAKGVTVLGGVIDESYRGEIQVIMANLNILESIREIEEQSHRDRQLLYKTIKLFMGLSESRRRPDITDVLALDAPDPDEKRRALLGSPITFKKGEKLTQLLVQMVMLPSVPVEPQPLTSTVRGAGGFGSTGK